MFDEEPDDFRDPDHPAEILKAVADRITSLILFSDLPDEAVDAEISSARAFCSRELPDRCGLFEMIYAARWRRLRSQEWRRIRP